LGKELDLVRKYLEIEKIRMEERLNYQILCPEVLAFCLVPPLLIEPIVENAVIHGIAPKREGGEIIIHIKKHDERLLINIKDNGLGIKGTDFSGGFGIYSVRERLELLYGKKGGFTVSPMPEGGTQVLLEIPCAQKDS
jgi:two-component system, LytTR family, sensor kinase